MKKIFSITLEKNLVEWLDEMVDNKIFSSRAAAIEYFVRKGTTFVFDEKTGDSTIIVTQKRDYSVAGDIKSYLKRRRRRSIKK